MHRVLHVISGLGPGGAQAVLARLIAATDASWQHAVISLVDDGATEHGISARAAVHGMNITGIGSLPGCSWRLRSIARQFAPTVIQGWMYHGNLAASWCGFMAHGRVPVAWNIRHSPQGLSYHGWATRLVVQANTLLSKHAAAIVFNSMQSRQAHERMGFCSTQSRVIANGFDTGRLAPCEHLRAEWRRNAAIPPGAFVFGHAARLHPVKNHAGALRAFAMHAANFPNAWLVMVGQDVDDTAAELAAIAALPGCKGRVLLLGKESNMPAFYNGIDCLVLSSWAEGMPNVIGEAMACAKPCITTDVGDAALLVGGSGWIVKTADVDLAEAMRAAHCMSSTELNELSRMARQRIVKDCSLAAMVDQYSRLYDSLCNDNMACAAHGHK